MNDYETTCVNLSSGVDREKDPDKPSIITVLYSIFVVIKLPYVIFTTRPDLIYIKASTEWGFARDMCIIVISKIMRKKLVCHLHSKSAGPLFLRQDILRQMLKWVMRVPDKVTILATLPFNNIPVDIIRITSRFLSVVR